MQCVRRAVPRLFHGTYTNLTYKDELIYIQDDVKEEQSGDVLLHLNTHFKKLYMVFSERLISS